MPTSRNVSRAIARSRAVRASADRRRRRRLLLGACVATIAGAPIVWFMAEPAAAVVASAATEARDLADLLGQRSPGTRTQAELTKHARVAAKVRAKPKTGAPQPAPAGPKTAELIDLLQPPVAPVSVVAENLAPLAPPPTLGAILAPPSINASFAPPSDGGPVHFPTSEPREELPPTSAVPEPGTWAMMLMGFGLIAWRVRRRSQLPKKLARRAAN
jgi:hypothetical protein